MVPGKMLFRSKQGIGKSRYAGAIPFKAGGGQRTPGCDRTCILADPDGSHSCHHWISCILVGLKTAKRMWPRCSHSNPGSIPPSWDPAVARNNYDFSGCGIAEMLDIKSAKELIQMCRTGRLYELEHWIAEGKSIDISAASRRRTPETLLEVAVETGFHSLVDLIARNEPSGEAKTAGLCAAVSAKRMDLIEVLCANGADPKTVTLDAVLFEWNPKLIRYFLERGADSINGRPFAEAFRERIRTALRPFVDYKREHPELGPQLQDQIDCALRYICGEGDLKWVCLLLWAGGDPRSEGPCLGKDWTEDPDCYTTGLQEACRPESIDVLKKLKPDPKRDNVKELLHSAALWSRSTTLEYLLELGSDPNDKDNGGSSAVDMVLRNLDFVRIGSACNSTVLTAVYEVRPVLECVRTLVSHGAAWRPESGYGLNSVRRALEKCQPEVTIELLRLFREFNSCPAETVHQLLGTPRVREHLSSQQYSLLRLGIHLESRSTTGRQKRFRRPVDRHQ